MRPLPSAAKVALLSSVLLYFFVIPLLVHAKQDTPIEISISTNEDLEPSGIIVFTLKNISPTPLEILPWGTPLEGIFTNKSFTISKDGKKAKYLGRQVKRRPLQDGDFITVNPGEHLSTQVTLTEGYSITEPGEYSARFTGFIYFRQLTSIYQSGTKNPHTYHRKFSSNILSLNVSSIPKLKVPLHEA